MEREDLERFRQHWATLFESIFDREKIAAALDEVRALCEKYGIDMTDKSFGDLREEIDAVEAAQRKIRE